MHCLLLIVFTLAACTVINSLLPLSFLSHPPKHARLLNGLSSLPCKTPLDQLLQPCCAILSPPHSSDNFLFLLSSLFLILVSSSFLCPYLRTLPLSLLLTSACPPFSVPSGECVYTLYILHVALLHALILLSYISLSLCALDNLTLLVLYHREIQTVNTAAVAPWMWFTGPQSVDICVSGLAEVQ